MPVILKIEHKDGQHTAIWEVKEDEYALLERASLNKAELRAFHLITNPGRRIEWLAVRALLKELYPTGAPTIGYLENGKPILLNHTDKISISHSGNMVAIAIHSGLTPGIDIEKIHPRIFKIATRFLNEDEKKHLATPPSIEQLTIIWAAKEVLFKIYEHGGISFKNDFRIAPFTLSIKGKLGGLIYKNSAIPVPMEYRKIGNFILVQTDYSYKDFEKKSDL
jgi:4'-phosphopantetheinyl transferase